MWVRGLDTTTPTAFPPLFAPTTTGVVLSSETPILKSAADSVAIIPFPLFGTFFPPGITEIKVLVICDRGAAVCNPWPAFPPITMGSELLPCPTRTSVALSEMNTPCILLGARVPSVCTPMNVLPKI